MWRTLSSLPWISLRYRTTNELQFRKKTRLTAKLIKIYEHVLKKRVLISDNNKTLKTKNWKTRGIFNK